MVPLTGDVPANSWLGARSTGGVQPTANTIGQIVKALDVTILEHLTVHDRNGDWRLLEICLALGRRHNDIAKPVGRIRSIGGRRGGSRRALCVSS